VTVSWNASTSAVVGYNVYRSTVSGGPYKKINSVLETSTDYVDTAVTAGTKYYYVVTAVNSAGVEGNASAQVSAAVPTP
jgi:fibronectin type 3 domain-containing protein